MIRKTLKDVQLELDFAGADEEARVTAALQEGLPPGAKLGGAFKKNRTTFHGKQLRTQEHEDSLRADRKEKSRKKKTDEMRGEAHDLITDIMNPPSVATEASDLMAEMHAVEELSHTEKLRTLYPRLSAIRTALAKLDVLHSQYAGPTRIDWNTLMFHDRSGTTIAESFLGTFHYYLEEILPMLAKGVVKTGKEAIAIHEHHIHEATDEARRRIADTLKNKR